MTEDSNPDSDEMCLADSPSSGDTDTTTANVASSDTTTDSSASCTVHTENEGRIPSLDMVGVDISQINITNQRGSIRCRWMKCGQWFPHLEMLATHVTHTHAVAGHNGLFYCGWEGCSRGLRGFNARYKMLVHVRTHTNEKPHHCFQCDKSFSRAENLKIHARSHTGERPYVCPVPGCGKAYSNSSDRFKHTRTHSVDKPYVCKVPGCPKRYTDPSSLRKHVKTFRHFPATASIIQTTPTTVITGTEPQITSIEINHNAVKLLTSPIEKNVSPMTVIVPSLHITGDESNDRTTLHFSPPLQQNQTDRTTEYLTTPGCQPFPAWPGFLRPWYDNGIIAWNTWQGQGYQSNGFVMDMNDMRIGNNDHKPISPLVTGEDEQDRPLDLTVQAK